MAQSVLKMCGAPGLIVQQHSNMGEREGRGGEKREGRGKGEEGREGEDKEGEREKRREGMRENQQEGCRSEMWPSQLSGAAGDWTPGMAASAGMCGMSAGSRAAYQAGPWEGEPGGSSGGLDEGKKCRRGLQASAVCSAPHWKPQWMGE